MTTISQTLHHHTAACRSNAMAGLPSDFDLVSLGGQEDGVAEALLALKGHKLVKSVTRQKRLTRFLKSVEEEADEGFDEDGEEAVEEVGEEVEAEPCESCSKTHGRRISGFWHREERRKSRKLLRAAPRQITSILQADTSCSCI